MKTLLVAIIFLSQSLWADEVITTGAARVEVPEEIVTANAAAGKESVSLMPGVVKATLPENEIPLTVDVTKKVTDAASTSTRLFMTVFILMTILGATYYGVRKYKLSNTINKSNTKIKVLSQHYLGPKKSLAIIHVAGESMLIGITETNISMIKSLSLIDDEVPTDLPQNFSDTLRLKNDRPAGAMARRDESGANAVDQNTGRQTVRQTIGEELEEEFSFAGVKDTVSKKIKSMRSLS